MAAIPQHCRFQSPRSAEPKKYNPCLGNVLLLYLGTVRTRRQFQMLSCNAAQGKDLAKSAPRSIRQESVDR
jgi:hypothetical protein